MKRKLEPSPPRSRATFGEPACLHQVAEFHDTFKCPVNGAPVIPSRERCELRVNLIQEEVDELKKAIEENDLVEVADALADIQYVLSGTVLEFGLGGSFGELFNEVHRSNMSKACTTQEEADATIAHYLAKDGTVAYAEAVGGKFNVYRTNDKKTLKSVKYSPVSDSPGAPPALTLFATDPGRPHVSAFTWCAQVDLKSILDARRHNSHVDDADVATAAAAAAEAAGGDAAAAVGPAPTAATHFSGRPSLMPQQNSLAEGEEASDFEGMAGFTPRGEEAKETLGFGYGFTPRPLAAPADSGNEAQLESQLRAMQQRLRALETENTALKAEAASSFQ